MTQPGGGGSIKRAQAEYYSFTLLPGTLSPVLINFVNTSHAEQSPPLTQAELSWPGLIYRPSFPTIIELLSEGFTEANSEA